MSANVSVPDLSVPESERLLAAMNEDIGAIVRGDVLGVWKGEERERQLARLHELEFARAALAGRSIGHERESD